MFLLILFNENTPVSIKCNALNFIGLPPIDAKIKCLNNRENIFLQRSHYTKCSKNKYIKYLINIIVNTKQKCNYKC